MKQKGFPLYIKRSFDLLFGLIILFLSSPFFLIATLVVKVYSPEAPVIFNQVRIGYKNKPMIIFKLRSMTNSRDENGVLLPDDQRLKRWGKIIRKTNLDEIPQFWNIIKGEMSLIGPRPILEKEMAIMSETEQIRRQSVLPGITGWEAVNEKKTSNRRQMAEFDLYYVDHWSLGFDLRICFETAFIILFNRRPADSIRAPKIEDEKT